VSGHYQDIASIALAEIRERSKLRLYQTDYQAWKWDILGLKTYEKMREITDTALFGEVPRTMIKSANGTAKSFEVSAMIAWAASVFAPGESISIVSAPSVAQIEKVIWAYLKTFYGTAEARNNKLPGWINESLEWNWTGPAGKVFLAYGRKPPEQDAVSVFQGVRSQFGRTYVWFDEAGGMSKGMYTAAEAVLTGADARFTGIGNPDNSGTDFEMVFRTLQAEYNLYTISAFDLPTLTGERVYPRTPEGDEMEQKMLKALTSRTWVEHKQRIWGESDARYKAKVLGEFPGDSDNAFFGQTAYDRAVDTDIPEDDAEPLVLGVDVARFGQDESVIYTNRGGRVRLLDSWGKTDTVTTAEKVHAHANRLGAAEMRIDAGGVGGGVFDMLNLLPQFQNKVYTLVAIDGGFRSPDIAQWADIRAYNHDWLRKLMMERSIDLDFDDKELREQLLAVTYKFAPRGGVRISPKEEMKTVMGGSPDRLDAVIYATLNLDWLLGNPVNQLRPGTEVRIDPAQLMELELEAMLSGNGMPM
jgi:hypothetical protein